MSYILLNIRKIWHRNARTHAETIGAILHTIGLTMPKY
jgi:hypothetical protein